MPEGKTLIIGDIHGCLDMFQRLMDELDWNPSADRLILIGDYVDRGNDAKGVIDYVLRLKRESHKLDCLIGNHERMFLDYLSGLDVNSFILNGGLSTLRSYKEDRRGIENPLIPPSHLDFLSSLSSIVKLDDYYVVHAGFRPGVKIDKQDPFDMVWIREEFIYSDHDFGKPVIFGHTPFYTPLVLKNKIGIDTGAVYGNRLTCLELPEKRFHSVGPR